MLHAFPMDNGPTPKEAGEPMDPVLEPYARLEVLGSYYTSGMAVFPECRGKGLGARMLKMAAQEARERQCREVSLLAFEKNEGAIKPTNATVSGSSIEPRWCRTSSSATRARSC